ncbi:hypothetical protein C10C_0338 [Chlamydia serpentis]|uniref:Uncharacterized protein n=1 Tax=Chlamydia serpentis TaxID=1967782 RepID=A0A2R8FAQ0_9CHLA|nr:hypothetical protein [Chlamydia serpentis]SPN73510.1 hypothetical protein C10C_0338 [Chlamydia serpentis]
MSLPNIENSSIPRTPTPPSQPTQDYLSTTPWKKALLIALAVVTLLSAIAFAAVCITLIFTAPSVAAYFTIVGPLIPIPVILCSVLMFALIKTFGKTKDDSQSS